MRIISCSDIPLALTDEALITAIGKSKEGRKAIAENLLYENSSLMIASEPGKGKSTIALQVAVELAAGLPIWGYFHVPQPAKVLWIHCERDKIEVLERLSVIGKTLPINSKNLVVTDEYQRLNYLTDFDVLIKCIKRDAPDVKVIFFDPIYATILGGLKDDKPASMFTNIMSRIGKTMNCTMWYNHHTSKQTYANDGSKIEKDDPFYGSQWLKAHVTGSYYMKGSENGVELDLKKDNYNLLDKHINLEYNPETGLCFIADRDKMPAIDKLKHFLRVKKSEKQAFTFKECVIKSGCAVRTLRELFAHPEIKGVLNEKIESGGRKIYMVKDVSL